MKQFILIITLTLYLSANSLESESFIKRLYTNIFQREADENGLKHWIGELESGKSALDVANYFYRSSEFKEQNLTDSRFLNITYKTFFDREADHEGKEYWLVQMRENNLLRDQIFYKFALSNEFAALTDNYGIITFTKDDQLRAFIERFYNLVLQRESDLQGLDYWFELLSKKKKDASDIAYEFFFSGEMIQKDLNNTEFVKIAYRTLLEREADHDGMNFWINKNKEEIIAGFINSNEFEKLTKNFLEEESWYKPSVDQTWQWQLEGTVNSSYAVDIYDIDLFNSSTDLIKDLQKSGKKVMCYFSAGSFENFREDAALFGAGDIGKVMDDWEDEKWLDIRSTSVKTIILSRLDLAKNKGCDGIEADNVDGYINDTGFDLSSEDQLKYNKFLAKEAHKRGLFTALKNDLDQIIELEPYFDLSVNEQCHEYNECDKLKPFIDNNKPVLNAEYSKKYIDNESDREKLCSDSKMTNFRTLILPIDLNDTFRYSCDRSNEFSYQLFFTNPDAEYAYKYERGVDVNITLAIDGAKKSIDIALYELSLDSIVQALIDAHRRNIKVRVFTDNSHLDWTAFEDLINENIEVKGDDRSALMHNKFIIIDKKEVWTGSMNLTYYGAYHNNENFIRIFNKDIVANYREEFEELFRGDYREKNINKNILTYDNTIVEIYFSPDDKFRKNRLLDLINNAKKSINFMAFTFTNKDIAESLVNAHNRGVAVKGIFDKEQDSRQRYSKFDYLIENDINITLDTNRFKLHHKVMLIDENITVTGSYNFTGAAEDRNDENSLVIWNKKIAEKFKEEFERLFLD